MKCFIVTSSEPFSEFVEIITCNTDFQEVTNFLLNNKWHKEDNIRVQVWEEGHLTDYYDFDCETRQLNELWSEKEVEE